MEIVVLDQTNVDILFMVKYLVKLLFVVIQKVENICNEFVGLGKEILRENIISMSCSLFVVVGKYYGKEMSLGKIQFSFKK